MCHVIFNSDILSIVDIDMSSLFFDGKTIKKNFSKYTCRPKINN